MNALELCTIPSRVSRVATAAFLAISILALFFFNPLPAQAKHQADFTSVGYIDGQTQTLYTSQNGLPSTAVTAIAQTSNGFIWIGGYQGLTSFDGQTFEPQSQAPNLSIESLLAGDDGTLWIGTSNQGLYRYSDGLFAQVDSPNLKKGFNEVLCMSKAADNSIVLGTEHGIATVDDKGQIIENSAHGTPDTPIRDIASSDEDTVMAITQDGHLFLFADGKAREVALSEANGTPRSVSYDAAAKSFLVGTNENTVCTFSAKGSALSHYEITGASCINNVTPTGESVLWVCCDNGIFSYRDGKTLKQNLQEDNSVDSMLIDSEGNHWFASSRQGLLLVGNTPFCDINSYANMPNRVVNALIKYQGRLLVGTDDGITLINPKTNAQVSDARFQVLDKLRIRDFKIDRNGSLWVATTGDGVLKMSKSGKWTAYTSENCKAITTNNFRCLYEWGSKMIAGSDNGAVVISGSDVRNALDNPKALSTRVMSISQMGNTLLFGTDNYGLQLVEDGKTIGSITTENGLPSNSVMKIRPCTNGNDTILVTSSNLVKLSVEQPGASQKTARSPFAVTVIDSLPTSNTLDVVQVDNGTVWVATGNGLYRTTEASLLENRAASSKLYTRRDGLPYDFTANSTQLVDGDLLYLAGTGGVSTLNMKTAAATSDDCNPSISGAYVDGSWIPLGANNTITIPASAERIKFNAHATTFNKRNLILYYKLDGYDSHETTTPLSNFDGLEYTNIEGGSYQLQFGTWDEASQAPRKSITVTVKKEYGLFDHPLTRILEIALLLGLAALAYLRHRRRLCEQLQKEYQEKEHHALEIMAYSDFLTDAYNRNYLNVWEKAAHERGCKFPLSLVTIDLNNLKQINDTVGHGAGDAYLRSVINAVFEAFGTENTKVVRMGGDEFLIIAEGLGKDEAVRCIDRTNSLLGKCGEGELQYSICYGAVQVDSSEFSLDEELRLADEQMMEEKRRYHESHDRRKC